ncbi:MAG: rod shape-determining protein RodA [Bacteroidia bacterium]|nr:rod shape-determining protein RodA [Bacteroidia bacterium]
MARKNYEIDFLSILLYLALVLLGWVSIYAVSSDGGDVSMWDFGTEHGRQMIWIGISLLLGLVILGLDSRIFEPLAYVAYGVGLTVLLFTLFVGKEVNGAKAWLTFGPAAIQPAEFMKVAAALALGRYMSEQQFTVRNIRKLLIAGSFVIIPALIVILQNDTGSALVFGSFLIVFYREGLSPLIPILLILIVIVVVLTLWLESLWIMIAIIAGITLVSFVVTFSRKNMMRLGALHLAVALGFGLLSFSTNFIVSKLPPHQQIRLKVLFDPTIDPSGAGYHVIQSKIAIGSGALTGKGFTQGSYTKFDFVPKQETDFIFCAIGEEFGWLGSSFVMIVLFVLILRVYYMAENSKTRLARVYGYCVLSILAFHVMVNIGMTIGLVPVIGIPLPFFSYGGSSLLAFTVMYFILINFYSHRMSVLGTKV